MAVPKSIDNDLLLIDKTFGFETAVEEAQKAILAAKVEASSACKARAAARILQQVQGTVLACAVTRDEAATAAPL